MTSLNNPVKLPLDANGNVLANVNAQNINPNVNVASGINKDANGNVLANVNAQNINPNVNNVAGSVAGSVASVTGAVGSVTTPPTIANPYVPLLLSHQTGLSGTSSTANAPVNVGSSITASRAGLLKIRAMGHVSAGTGFIDFILTIGGIAYYIIGNTASNLNLSILSATMGVAPSTGFISVSENLLYPTKSSGQYGDLLFTLEIPVNTNDVIQFRVSNGTASDTTYIDDLEVVLQ
jgi:hypothetical protein